MTDKIIKFLLENANPSIVYRMKKEILQQITESEENDLIAKILADKNVKIVTGSQQPDGWFDINFHGSSGMFDNMEVGLRFLAEKGLPPEHEVISKAVQALIKRGKNDPAYGLVKLLKTSEDDYIHTGVGVYLPRSSIVLRAGYENIVTKNDSIDLNYDIEYSLKSFLNVLTVDDINDVIYRRRGKLCFKHGTLWPNIYHLRMLAFSNNWRSKENLILLSKSINRLFELPQRGEFVYTYCMNQLKGPCMAFIHSRINESLKDESVGGMWFDRMELFARCGAIQKVEPLRKEYEMLINTIEDGVCNINVNSKYALGWSPYFGFALEEDWRSKFRKQCDILFRVLLIMHYTEGSK